MDYGRLTFIGAGNMAASLIGGLIAEGYPVDRITACDPAAEARARLTDTFGIATTDDNRTAACAAETLVLAVKPQVMATVARELAPALAHCPLVISIAAGIPLDALASWLGSDIPLVRCMPNTPALVRTAATALYAGPGVSHAQRVTAERILQAVGLAVWLEEESQIDAVTALSGSGPAYFFLVMEAMMAAGRELGLAPAIARELTVQTALGAARMAGDGEVDVAELRRRVTSPGGTTEAAIGVLEAGGLAALFAAALRAAEARAREMGAAAGGPRT
ncbi:MAG: pyrroline-5-carboxylate reductase [Porticoccaceae bacterium]